MAPQGTKAKPLRAIGAECLKAMAEADVLANIAALPEKTVFVAAHRAKAREFATMRLRVDGGVVSAEG